MYSPFITNATYTLIFFGSAIHNDVILTIISIIQGFLFLCTKIFIFFRSSIVKILT